MTPDEAKKLSEARRSMDAKRRITNLGAAGVGLWTGLVAYYLMRVRSRKLPLQMYLIQLRVGAQPAVEAYQMASSHAPLVNGNSSAHSAADAYPKAIVPPNGTKIGIRIVHIENLNCFFVVPEADLAKLEKLALSLKSVAIKSEPAEPACLSACLLAMHPDDGEWYRAVALDWPRHSACLVRFIDYGNAAVVPAEFLTELPAFAIECSLAGCDHADYGPGALASFRKLLNRPGVTAEIAVPPVAGQGDEDPAAAAAAVVAAGPVGVRLSINDIDVLGRLPKLAAKLSLPRHRVKLSPASENIVDAGPFDARSDRQEDLLQLSELLEPAAESSTGFSTGELIAGDVCIGYYLEGWYRARVLSTDEQAGTVDLLYIDYGNAETKSLRGTFQQHWPIPPPCRRRRRTPQCRFKPDAGELLVGLTEETVNEAEAEPKKRNQKPRLSSKPSLTPLNATSYRISRSPPTALWPAFDAVVVVADLTEDRCSAMLWLQRDSDQEALAGMQEALEAAAADSATVAGLGIEDLAEGDGCIGVYEEAWYRARVLSLNPVSVLFVDYGNVESAATRPSCSFVRCRPAEPSFEFPPLLFAANCGCPVEGGRFKPDAGAALVERTDASDKPLLLHKIFIVNLDQTENDFLMELIETDDAGKDAGGDDEAAEEAGEAEQENDEAIAEAGDDLDETIVEDEDQILPEDADGDIGKLRLSVGDTIVGCIAPRVNENDESCDDAVFYVRREDSAAVEARTGCLAEALAKSRW
uniref:Tudor domain-containing protein n=1 Tax=Macrostomum lignano TaxID=282301 RepID=A0A1I8IGL8_9PLAT